MLLTFFPALSYISGFSRVLQTLWRMVVFPAFALPIMRTRKRLNLCLNFEESMEEGQKENWERSRISTSVLLFICLYPYLLSIGTTCMLYMRMIPSVLLFICL